VRSAGGGTVSGSVRLWGQGGTQESGGTGFTVGPTWTLVSAPLDTINSGHTSFRAEVYMNTTGVNYDLDGAQLVRAGLSDASFEDPTGGPWFGCNFPASVQHYPYPSASFAHEGGSVMSMGTTTPQGSVAQDVAVAPQPGESYTFSVWLRSDVKTGSGTVRLWALGGTEESGSTSFTAGPAWTLVSAPLDVVNSGHTGLRAEIYMGTANFYYFADAATLVSGNARPPSPVVLYSSLRGSDRYDTALKISKAMYAGALPLNAGLVLAPGETFQEALCGAPLASAYYGPVLLTGTTVLYSTAKAELQRLSPTYVFCIGLSSAVVNAVKAALPSATVTAINGTGGSVYDMSYKVAKALGAVSSMTTATAIITRGDVFPDAIGVSPLACKKRWPILLTNSGGSANLNGYAAQALNELGITKALKVGTYVTLPPGITGVANLSGGDRYKTNANVADWGYAHAGLFYNQTGIATGDKFPDALAAGPYLAKGVGGILLLSPLAGPLPTAIGNLLATHRLEVERFSFIAMIEPVISQVKALLP
jgi:putative cell wall-binding protein